MVGGLTHAFLFSPEGLLVFNRTVEVSLVLAVVVVCYVLHVTRACT